LQKKCGLEKDCIMMEKKAACQKKLLNTTSSGMPQNSFSESLIIRLQI
jgi:hypothetical protein